MRVVLDANVLISAVISPRGNPATILCLWQHERFDLVISDSIMEELERVLYYPRIRERYHLPERTIQQFLQLIAGSTTIMNPIGRLSVIDRDPSDNRYLECAVESRASYIVSGDNHLLGLKEYEGITILDPTGFLTALALEEGEQSL